MGQHVLLRVRKRDANTQWVARELAKFCRCRPMDVGYAGLKDRRAVAVQWFTVPKTSQPLEAWTSLQTPEFEVLEAHAHTRKLPRGALAGNGFVIRVRDVAVTDQQLAERVELIARRGVPNYFGPQRFGRQGSNLAAISVGLKALRMPQRGFVLSAARSLIFNAALAERVRDGSWDHLEAGDVANLDGRGSVFAIDAIDDTLVQRCLELDIHPTGPMWGRGRADSPRGQAMPHDARPAAHAEPFVAGAGPPTARAEPPVVGRESPAAGGELPLADGEPPAVGGELPLADEELPVVGGELAAGGELPVRRGGLPVTGSERSVISGSGRAPHRGHAGPQGRVLELERRVGARLPEPCALVEDAGMEQERRSLRLTVRNFEWTREPDAVVLRFRLMRGSFATTVLREVFDFAVTDAEPEGDG